MERFCGKCGTLVSGDGEFCPSCGARLEGAVSSSSSGVDLNKPGVEPMMPGASTSVSTPTPIQNTYQGQSTSYNQQPIYPQPYNQAPAQPEMTVGNWVLTIFLSGLGIIGLILLFVWGFSDSTPIAKKNYARAMLIWQAIAVGLVILFYVGLIACVAAMGYSMEEILNSGYAMLIPVV